MLFSEYLHSISLRNLHNHIPELHGVITTNTTLQDQYCLVPNTPITCTVLYVTL
jgi:hypothetical protein